MIPKKKGKMLLGYRCTKNLFPSLSHSYWYRFTFNDPIPINNDQNHMAEEGKRKEKVLRKCLVLYFYFQQEEIFLLRLFHFPHDLTLWKGILLCFFNEIEIPSNICYQFSSIQWVRIVVCLFDFGDYIRL